MTEWRMIDGWPYEVSSDGLVRRTGRAFGAVVGRILKPTYRSRYPMVKLVDCGRVRDVAVHILVCEVFHGPRTEGCVARHLDGDATNSRADNVAWGTQIDNMADARRHGSLCVGTRHHSAKLTEAAVLQLLAEAKAGATIGELAKQYGLSRAATRRIVTHQRWRHLSEAA